MEISAATPGRLNLGCGRKVLPGWFNVDIALSERAPRPPELLADLRGIPLPDACASEIMAIHVLEHFYRWEVAALLAEWRRLLVPGGLLVLELPNLRGCIANWLKGGPDKGHMWGLYGNPDERDPFMCHRWGWTPETLTPELEAAGFRSIVSAVPKFHDKGKTGRDMRIEARK